MRGPLRSTLFPYTTLFRSLWFGLGIWSKIALGVTVVFFIVFFNTHQGVRDVDPVVVNKDRKSTRLNSSHGSISYAVFCLNRKTPSHSTIIRDRSHRRSTIS